MSSSINTSNNFPYSVLSNAVCGVISDYLGCYLEASEALCLQNSQEKESLEKEKRQIITNIWKSFVESISPKNPVLDRWIDKYSLRHKTEDEKKLDVVLALTEEYVESRMSHLEIVSIKTQFPNGHLHLQKIEALTRKMNEMVEFESSKKIVIGIARTISLELVNSAQSLNTKDAIENWISQHRVVIADIDILDLSEIELNAIPGMFSYISLPNLRSINLSSNNLKIIPERFGDNWPLLTKILLHENELQVLPEQFGGNWPLLTKILLHENELQVLPEQFGDNWPLLTKILLHENKLQVLPEQFGSSWSLLNSISLSQNELASLPQQFGVNWLQLGLINLQENKLQVLPEQFGNNWPLLKEISLRQNELQVLPEQFGVSWLQLARIFLGQNKLQVLTEQFGSNWPLLTYISLNQNKLQSLPQGFGSSWIKLNLIILTDNPSLKKRSENFGSKWPKEVEINTDSWFKPEALRNESMTDVATSSLESLESAPVEEETIDYSESSSLDLQNKTLGVKRALKQSPADLEEEKEHEQKKQKTGPSKD